MKWVRKIHKDSQIHKKILFKRSLFQNNIYYIWKYCDEKTIINKQLYHHSNIFSFFLVAGFGDINFQAPHLWLRLGDQNYAGA